MKKTALLIVLGIWTIGLPLAGQVQFPPNDGVFNPDHVLRIEVFMDAADLEEMVADFTNGLEYPVTVLFHEFNDSDTLEQVGIGFRGNTSLYSAKKSFKLSFNSFQPGRKYQGLEKMNLNGEHNDPSVIRSRLYWTLLRSMKVPGPRASHAEVYINGSYYGLYINVEHIDEEFVESRFGNKFGNLYKCLWPANLDYISNNPDDYKMVSGDHRTYELQTNTDEDDYSDLAELISVLEFAPDASLPAVLEAVFNVNSFLRSYAVDVSTGNWDGYAYNQNNYYLYHDPATGRFEFIPYDTDNTFGIDWFGIDWAEKNVYDWYNDNLDLALVKRICGIPEYVDRFTFFLSQLQEGLMEPAHIFPKVDSVLQLIQVPAQNDLYRTYDYGWSYQDFLDSYTEALGGHVTYGLKPYFQERYDQSGQQLNNSNVIPVISDLHPWPGIVHPGDSVSIRAWVEDEENPVAVTLFYRLGNGPLLLAGLSDDGLHHDGLAGDHIYGVSLSPSAAPDTLWYYLEARDVLGQTGREPRSGEYFLPVAHPPQLVINELLASNTAANTDAFGEYDDWLELYNLGNQPVALATIYLSDEADQPGKWRLPDASLNAKGFLLIWCDDQTYQGDYHAGFKLAAEGETVFLSEGTGNDYFLLDSVSWANLPEDQSIGCQPDGVKPLNFLEGITPGFSNLNIGIPPAKPGTSIHLFPNPFRDELNVLLPPEFGTIWNLEVRDLLGRTCATYPAEIPTAAFQVSISLAHLSPGIYFLVASVPGVFESTAKIIRQ